MKIILLDFWNVVGSTGGTEKVLCNMANTLAERGFDVTIICNDVNIGKPFFFLKSQVKFVNIAELFYKNIPFWLKMERELKRFLHDMNKEYYRIKFKHYNAIRNLHKILKQIEPDVIITYDPDSLIVLKEFINNTRPTIAMLHMNARFFFNNKMSNLLLSAYKKTDCIQVLSKNDINIVKEYCKNINVVYIANVVETNVACKNYDNCSYNIVNIGRLNKDQKRQDLIIKAFNLIKNKINSNWHIELIGGAEKNSEKDYKNYLLNIIDKCNLQNKIILSGVTNNVEKKLKDADIFAFPSAYEGMPLALTEAMAAGLPVIGYKSCPSVNELIIDGYNGFLCEDGIDDFAKKLKLLMNNPEMRKRMGENARESMKKFAPQKIWDQWEILINTIGSKK